MCDVPSLQSGTVLRQRFVDAHRQRKARERENARRSVAFLDSPAGAHPGAAPDRRRPDAAGWSSPAMLLSGHMCS